MNPGWRACFIDAAALRPISGERKLTPEEFKMNATNQSMNAATSCQAVLTAARALARQRKGWTDRGCGVLDNGADYYVVEDEYGEYVWEGSAHCRWCARAHALARMTQGEFVLIVDGAETQPPYAGPEAAMLAAIKAHDLGGRVIRLRSPTGAVYVFTTDGRGAFSWTKPRRPLTERIQLKPI
jgi:hypothetical protein